MSQYKDNHDKHQAGFDMFVRLRDKAEQAGDKKLAERYQKKVSKAHSAMYEKGYFRDSYNSSNLLWKMDLDYWAWFAGLLDEDGNLTPDKAREVINAMQKRQKIFHSNLTILDDEETEYFLKKYDEFTNFLLEAINLNEPIGCSI
ncbi:hypothetical protein [Polynucleobacter sp.]|uniref:hypothetical protein n=1 Tax=Polynucleobacter sp. TaxID=2029855 RepID=UPI003F696A15